MSIDRQMGKQKIVYAQHEILLGVQKEGNPTNMIA